MRTTQATDAWYHTQDGQVFTIRPLQEEDLPALEWDGEYLHFRLLYRSHYKTVFGATPAFGWLKLKTERLWGRSF